MHWNKAFFNFHNQPDQNRVKTKPQPILLHMSVDDKLAAYKMEKHIQQSTYMTTVIERSSK